jgi:UDP-N-acetyl-2-amino-2-deoxyglucuronate dehydrogenase
MKKFALIGAAGYVAPRHMKAIRDTGNELVAALDPNDSVGVIDDYFPEANFFTEFERFDRHVDLLARREQKIDYVSIVSPNYLHDSHIRFALRVGADAICEKPLVVNPWNIDGLRIIEAETGRKVFNILQLRLHPSVIALKAKVARELDQDPGKVFDIDLSYITSRGNWYFASWKGEEKKSGGIVANIGIHFYDMLQWIFGAPRDSTVHVMREDVAAGFFELEHARVRWFLSLSSDYLPDGARNKGQRTWRSLQVEGEEVEFSGGFADLHTASYEQILAGGGFGLDEALPGINMVHGIRTSEPRGKAGDYHPLVKKALGK